MKTTPTIENNYEDDMKLEPQLLKKTGQDLRETPLRSSNAESEDEKCHKNCWALRNEELKRLNQRWKEFESDLGEGMWLMEIILTSHFKKNLSITPEK